MSGSNGVTVMGPDARRTKWGAWYICRVAGALVVGRLHEDAQEKRRWLSPFYDLNSGFAATPQGIAEVHNCFPPLALSLKRLDLPEGGYVLWSFSDLDDSELEGMEAAVQRAEDLWNQMRAARSGILQAPAIDLSKLPKMPRH